MSTPDLSVRQLIRPVVDGGGHKAIRVHVDNGRISGDAPPGLPDGDVDLVLADGDDEMTEAELARLNDALELGFAAINVGGFPWA